jgi:prefoldin subunit 5
MKKFLLVFLVLVFIPYFNVYGQPMIVADIGVNTLLAESGVAQAIHYAQMIADNITMIENTITMVENFKEQTERTVQNLASIKDIGSWDDFMDFYNRQLYLERQTAEAWDKINIKIGQKEYHIHTYSKTVFTSFP